MYKIALSQLSPETKRKLFEGMGKSKKGRDQLAVYREIKKIGLFTIGASFMMKQADYDEYMRDAE